MVSCQSLLHYCTGGVLVLWLCGGFWPHRQRNSKVATRETESQIALIASRLSVAYSYSSKATVTMAIVFFAITVCDLHTFAYCSLSFFFCTRKGKATTTGVSLVMQGAVRKRDTGSAVRGKGKYRTWTAEAMLKVSYLDCQPSRACGKLKVCTPFDPVLFVEIK